MITREGYEVWQTEIMVQNGGNHSIDARLVPVAMTVMTSIEYSVPIMSVLLAVMYLWIRKDF